MADPSPMPTALTLEAGTHALCRCGVSQNGAFRDGSHKGTGKSPEILTMDAPLTVSLCSCGTSANSPYWAGSHHKLRQAASVPRPWWKFRG